ncbi:MAG: DUF1833 family protein [Pseudomonadota bacterium]
MNRRLKKHLHEVYASASGTVINTLEIRHPGSDPVRIYQGINEDTIQAMLEDDAPINQGEVVAFDAMGFDVAHPTIDESPIPELTIKIDNVGRDMMAGLTSAVSSEDTMKITYRVYLSNALVEGPAMRPSHFIITEARADVYTVMFRCKFAEIGSLAFPARLYRLKHFPGLAA